MSSAKHRSIASQGSWPIGPWLMLCLLVVAEAKADGGELTLGATIDQEWASLHYSQSHNKAGQSGHGAYLPRFGAAVHYGLHNRLRLGMAVRASLPRSSTFAIESLDQKYYGGALIGTYSDILATATLSTTLSEGQLWHVELAAEAGASAQRWQLTRRINSSDELEAIAAEYSTPTWSVAPYLRIGPELEWRPFQYLSLTANPYVSLRLPKQPAFGANVAIGVPLPAGPSL